MTLDLLLGNWEDLGVEAYRIRYAVFVEEQGVPAELEQDEHDVTSLHLLLKQGNVAIATGRLLDDGHIGRIAVLAPHRRQGHGRRVMRVLIEEASRRGHSVLHLHAQTDAQAFYAALGFVATGEVFMEAGILHVQMSKRL